MKSICLPLGANDLEGIVLTLVRAAKIVRKKMMQLTTKFMYIFEENCQEESVSLSLLIAWLL